MLPRHARALRRRAQVPRADLRLRLDADLRLHRLSDLTPEAKQHRSGFLRHRRCGLGRVAPSMAPGRRAHVGQLHGPASGDPGLRHAPAPPDASHDHGEGCPRVEPRGAGFTRAEALRERGRSGRARTRPARPACLDRGRDPRPLLAEGAHAVRESAGYSDTVPNPIPQARAMALIRIDRNGRSRCVGTTTSGRPWILYGFGGAAEKNSAATRQENPGSNGDESVSSAYRVAASASVA